MFPEKTYLLQTNRRHFIGGSDARIIMGADETALFGCGGRNAAKPSPRTCRATSSFNSDA